jgi:hypothetical protein
MLLCRVRVAVLLTDTQLCSCWAFNEHSLASVSTDAVHEVSLVRSLASAYEYVFSIVVAE